MQNKPVKKLSVRLLGVLLLALAFSAGLLWNREDLNAQKNEAQKTFSSTAPAPTLKMGDPLPANAFVELARVVNPAVVNIQTLARAQFRRGARDPFFDMLEQFYGFRLQPPPGNPDGTRPMSLGTGFVIREDGLIVTNNHVISGADVIKVQFSEAEKAYEATVIGSDERTDIALIKVTSDLKLSVLRLGNSKDLQVGEWVAAFGNPYGQGHTMTKGIISAKGRDLNEINRFPLLQTDTPINPGNSGGPLVNLRGEVIGVNAAIDARAQGIGFAIPIDEVKSVIPQLEKTGRVKKAFLGVVLAEVNPNLARHLGLKDEDGAVIAQVEGGSPADKAGLQAYDVVREFNGRKITNVVELQNAVADAPIDSEVALTYIREGKELKTRLKLSPRPEGPVARRGGRGGVQELREQRGQKAPHGLGFEMAQINDQLRAEFNLPADLPPTSVIVVFIEPRLAANALGLRPGDVILDINRKSVSSVAVAVKLLKKGSNSLRVARGDRVIILVLNSP